MFVESDGFSEIIVVTSVAPVVVTIPESEVTIPPVESSTGDWLGIGMGIALAQVKKPLHSVVVTVVVVVGPAVTGAAAVVEH